ncbi:MAG: hypothetical protein ACF8CQ_00840 [Rhodopirellula sp. JB044]|uniref:hypothetical protein n=1 Tax=Rhodopirellula sp. JB044 TaxID=3342844 RepID=UPI00370CBB05
MTGITISLGSMTSATRPANSNPICSVFQGTTVPVISCRRVGALLVNVNTETGLGGFLSVSVGFVSPEHPEKTMTREAITPIGVRPPGHQFGEVVDIGVEFS